MFRALYAIALAVLLTACAEADPYTTGGVWQPTGINTLNISTMVVNKGDLIRGRGATGSNGTLSASAVTRLLEGNPKPLPKTDSKSSGGS